MTATRQQLDAIALATGPDGWPDTEFTEVDGNMVAEVVSHRTGDRVLLIVRPDGSVIDRTLGVADMPQGEAELSTEVGLEEL